MPTVIRRSVAGSINVGFFMHMRICGTPQKQAISWHFNSLVIIKLLL